MASCLPIQLQDQIRALQAQLSLRPPIEAIQELRKEYSNLELILQGTQRENERAMTELERLVLFAVLVETITHSPRHLVDRSRQREKLLERELERLAGSNWQVRVLTMPVLSMEAHSHRALALYPVLTRLIWTSHLLALPAHSPRALPHLSFLPGCSISRRHPQVMVAQTQRPAWKQRRRKWSRYACWSSGWRNASACGKRNL